MKLFWNKKFIFIFRNNCNAFGSCQFKCINVTSENVLYNILELHNTSNCDLPMSLKIRGIKFPNNILQGNWLGQKWIGPIETLELFDHEITDIYANGFLSDVFRDLTTLEIRNFRVRCLHDGVFGELKNLQNLLLSNVPLFVLNMNAFVTNENLLAINFKYCTTNGVRLVSSKEKPMKRLKSLIIAGNYLHTQSMRDSLIGMPNLMNLDLSLNNISYLPIEIFDPIDSAINTIGLKYNKFTTLSIQLFERLFLTRARIVSISNNPWHCNYDILDLRNFIIKYEYYFDNVLCHSPEMMHGQKLINVKIPTTTTAPTPQGPTSAITITSVKPDDLIPVKCEKLLVDSQQTLNLTKRQFKIKILIESDGWTRIKFDNFPRSKLLLWIENSKDMSSKCFIKYSINQIDYKVVDIKWNKSYLMCVMPRIGGATSPSDCMSFSYKRSLESQNNWISVRSRSFCIFILIFTGFAFLGMGFTFVVYLSRSYSQIFDNFLSKFCSRSKR